MFAFYFDLPVLLSLCSHMHTHVLQCILCVSYVYTKLLKQFASGILPFRLLPQFDNNIMLAISFGFFNNLYFKQELSSWFWQGNVDSAGFSIERKKNVRPANTPWPAFWERNHVELVLQSIKSLLSLYSPYILNLNIFLLCSPQF